MDGLSVLAVGLSAHLRIGRQPLPDRELGQGKHTMLIRDVIQTRVMLHKGTVIIDYIAARAEKPALVDPGVPPVCLVVNVVHQMLRYLDCLKFLEIHTSQLFLAVNAGIKLIAIQILRQVD